MYMNKGTLASILVSDTKKHKLTIRFDKEKAKYFLKNSDNIFSCIGSTNSKGEDITSSTINFMKYVKQYSKPHGNKVIFSTEHSGGKVGWGRLTPDLGRGYVALRRSIRHFMAYDLYSDHDIVNCHPVIVRHLFQVYDMDDAVLLIDEFNNNRENILLNLSKASSLEVKPTRDECKKIGYCFLYDGSVDLRFKELGVDISDEKSYVRKVYNLCTRLCQEVIGLRKAIAKDFPIIWDSLPYNIKKGDNRKDTGKFSSLVQHIERHIMLTIADFATEHGYQVGDYCHDGLFLSENDSPADVPSDFYEKCEDHVLKTLGFTIKLVNKEMEIDPVFQPYQDKADGLPDPYDEEKVKRVLNDITSHSRLDLNKLKSSYFSAWSDAEKNTIISEVLKKYFIRVSDKWYCIDTKTGLWVHEKPLSKDSYTQFTTGTLLFAHHDHPSIYIYQSLVFKDPQTVKPGEYNTYYKEMPYSRDNRTPLSVDELNLINPFLSHMLNIICRGDNDSYIFLLNLLRNKFLKPFEVNHHSRCIVMFGSEGCGKTSWLTTLMNKAFGPPFVNSQASFKSCTASDGFTNALEHILFCIMNDIPEYDYNHTGMFENFKSMITDAYRRSHPKFMSETSVPNTIMYAGTTNNRNSFHLSGNDRRYFITDVSGEKMISRDLNNLRYHTDLIECIEQHYLLIIRHMLSLPDVNMPIPQTAARIHAQSLSKCPIGYWLETYCKISKDWKGKVMETYLDYKDWCKQENHRPLSKDKFVGKLMDKYYISKSTDNNNRPILYINDFHEFCSATGWSDESDAPPEVCQL